MATENPSPQICALQDDEIDEPLVAALTVEEAAAYIGVGECRLWYMLGGNRPCLSQQRAGSRRRGWSSAFWREHCTVFP
jgi:hypothetical protein